MERKNWTREELIVAFNLYCKIPFGKINYHNEQVIKLAKAIGRTPSAVAWKLVNFAKFLDQKIELGDEQEIEKIILKEGKTREAIVKIRVNQSFFRSSVLASYDNKCCITGIQLTDLLIASHIVPWSKDEKNRLNPENGLCLNSFHDRAFDKGLITIDTDYKIKISKSVAVFQKE